MATLGVPARARQTPPSPRTRTAAAAPVLLTTTVVTGLLTGLLVGAGGPAQAADGGAATAGLLDPLSRDLVFSFDELGADGHPLLESLGVSDVVATVSSAGGGEVLAGPDRTQRGHSLRLERFRPDQPATPAVVVVRPALGAADPTEPGTRAFAFGAEFALDASAGMSPSDNGDNLVQRGLFGAGPQYKLELDNRRPSCRVAGSEGAVQVRATEQVDAGAWYRVRCRRTGDTVTLRVVSSDNGEKQVWEYAEEGRTGSLSYGAGDAPFTIGGKTDEDGRVLVGASDQFNGLVDDVVFRELD